MNKVVLVCLIYLFSVYLFVPINFTSDPKTYLDIPYERKVSNNFEYCRSLIGLVNGLGYAYR